MEVEAVACKSLANVVALQVLGGVSGNGDVIVIDDELDVQVLRDGETGGLGVISLLSSVPVCENPRRRSAREGAPAGSRRNQA